MAESARIEPGSGDVTGWLRNAAGSLRLPPISLAFPPLALLLWALSLDQIDFDGMNDLGLVSVLPPVFFASFLVLAIGFVLTLRTERVSQASAFLHTAALAIILFGTTAAVEEAPRFAATWKHIGISEYIIRNEALDTRLDAYFSWPGAFILSALLTESTGLDNPVALAGWASLFFNLLYLLPLFIIFRSLVKDQRVRWFGIWLFYLGNWIGQDYFAPQALDYLLYLSVLAILLHWFPRPPSVETSGMRHWIANHMQRVPSIAARLDSSLEQDGEHPPTTPGQRVVLMGVVLIVIAAMAPSHQLTPVALVISLGALVLFQRIQPTGIVLYAGMVVAGWVVYATVPFLLGHLEGVASGVGQLNENVNSGVSSRVSGSQEHILVVRMRLIMSAAFVLLAGIGVLARLRNGRWDIIPILLAGAPALLLALQAYGGEVVLRAFFFSLPGLAVLVALAVFPSATQTNLRVALTAGGLSIVLFTGFLFARYGNERMDYYTAEEVAAIAYLYAEAPDGAVLIAGGPSVPWKAERYEDFSERVIPARLIRDGNPEAIGNYMREIRDAQGSEIYFVTTRSTSAAVDLFYGLESGALDQLVEEMTDSGTFHVVFANEDATILSLPVPEDSADTSGP